MIYGAGHACHSSQAQVISPGTSISLRSTQSLCSEDQSSPDPYTTVGLLIGGSSIQYICLSKLKTLAAVEAVAAKLVTVSEEVDE